jgi:hypothetical protein
MAHLDTSFKISTLIYLKALMRPLSSLSQTSSYLATTLKSSLCNVRDAPRSLTLWMGFWGLLASREGSEERGWFGDRILVDIMILKGRMCGWEEVRGDFGKVFWVGELFDEYSKEAWTGMERDIIASRLEEV